MGKVIPFKRPEDPPIIGFVKLFVRRQCPNVEHDPSTTIVERIEMTPELKQAFENAGYEVEDET